MSLLEVNDLAFSFGDKLVFEHVSFTVDPGQVFCLVGPNGCGKTTLEHCVLMHLKPQRGDIRVNGKSLSEYSERELAGEVAYVPQTHVRSFPYRTIDVVAMGRACKQRFLDARADHEQYALEIMDQLGIDHLAEKEYTTLSGGELQMVLLARALVQESKMLVLDEPVAHLDVRRTQDILLLLAKLAKSRGLAILLSTHDFNHPLMLEDEGIDIQMGLMEGGRMSEIGVPTQILSSGCLNDIYGIESQIVEIPGEPVHHFLATWSNGRKDCVDNAKR